MLSLIEMLDSINSDWRKSTTILIDNASIHRAKLTKSYFE